MNNYLPDPPSAKLDCPTCRPKTAPSKLELRIFVKLREWLADFDDESAIRLLKYLGRRYPNRIGIVEGLRLELFETDKQLMRQMIEAKITRRTVKEAFSKRLKILIDRSIEKHLIGHGPWRRETIEKEFHRYKNDYAWLNKQMGSNFKPEYFDYGNGLIVDRLLAYELSRPSGSANPIPNLTNNGRYWATYGRKESKRIKALPSVENDDEERLTPLENRHVEGKGIPLSESEREDRAKPKHGIGTPGTGMHIVGNDGSDEHVVAHRRAYKGSASHCTGPNTENPMGTAPISFIQSQFPKETDAVLSQLTPRQRELFDKLFGDGSNLVRAKQTLEAIGKTMGVKESAVVRMKGRILDKFVEAGLPEPVCTDSWNPSLHAERAKRAYELDLANGGKVMRELNRRILEADKEEAVEACS